MFIFFATKQDMIDGVFYPQGCPKVGINLTLLAIAYRDVCRSSLEKG